MTVGSDINNPALIFFTSQGQEGSELDRFPVDQYHNSFYLFWILEELLQRSEVPCRVEPGSQQTGLLKHLEQRVLLWSDEFPLFSIYMWRVGGLLTSDSQNHQAASEP